MHHGHRNEPACIRFLKQLFPRIKYINSYMLTSVSPGPCQGNKPDVLTPAELLSAILHLCSFENSFSLFHRVAEPLLRWAGPSGGGGDSHALTQPDQLCKQEERKCWRPTERERGRVLKETDSTAPDWSFMLEFHPLVSGEAGNS